MPIFFREHDVHLIFHLCPTLIFPFDVVDHIQARWMKFSLTCRYDALFTLNFRLFSLFMGNYMKYLCFITNPDSDTLHSLLYSLRLSSLECGATNLIVLYSVKDTRNMEQHYIVSSVTRVLDDCHNPDINLTR